MNKRLSNHSGTTTVLLALAVSGLFLAVPGASIAAQRVLGPGPDAVTLEAGRLRIGIGGEHTTFHDRWRDGEQEPLGQGFRFAAFGPSQLAVLGPLQQAVRDLGVPDFSASLGSTRLALRQRVFATPFSLDFGVTDWLTVGASAPLVRVRAEALFRLDGSTATLGPNPYFLGSAVPGANQTTIDAFTSAAASLAARRDGCIANPASAPECATILAESAQVDALIASTNAFAGGLGATYGGDGAGTPAAYVPLAGSPAETALLARVDALRTDFTRYGVTDISPTTGLPLGAQTPLSAADLEQLLRDPVNGYGARPLESSAQLGIGDIDIHAKLKLFDSFGRAAGGPTAGRLGADGFGIRQSVGVTYRLGTGTPGAPGDFLDLGTGSGENAIGARSYTDIVFNDRFWTSAVVGWAQAQGEDALIRVPTVAGDQLLEAWREMVVPVDRGAVLQAEVAPRFLLGDYVSIGGYWGWRRHEADNYTVPATATGAPTAAGTVTFDVAGMAAANARDEQRAGFSVTFSTLAANARGGTNLGFELSYSHRQSIASGEGIVPKAYEHRLQLRYYTRLFGR